MENGKVITGYSKPFVATYSAAGSTVTYSGGIPLARGVDVNMTVNSSDVKFFADNSLAEGSVGMFTDGSVSLTVDGLKSPARKLISGQSATETYGTTGSTQDFDAYGKATTAPYVGLGFVVRCQSAGTVSYDAVVLPKIQFSQASLEAATQEENVAFQTQKLEATVYTDDTSAGNWKLLAEGFETEAAAVTAYQKVLTPATT